MYTASVDDPLEVRIGGAPDLARAWYARKIKPKESIRNRRAIILSMIADPATGEQKAKLRHN
jgi:hypothetical protein